MDARSSNRNTQTQQNHCRTKIIHQNDVVNLYRCAIKLLVRSVGYSKILCGHELSEKKLLVLTMSSSNEKKCNYGIMRKWVGC